MTRLPDMAKSDGTIVNATITAGGTSQQLKARNPARSFIQIQNNSAEALWINFGAAAATDTGISIAAGATWTSPANYCPTATVNIIGATTGSKFNYLIY